MPIHLIQGTPGYMPPEYYVGVDNINSLALKMGSQKEPSPIIIDELVSTPSNVGCNLKNKNLTLNELVAIVYPKYMYNEEQLINCRHLIKSRIEAGDILDTSYAEHLKQIDMYLYKFYVQTRKNNATKSRKGGYHKKKKNNKKIRKTKKQRKLRKK